MLDRAPRLVLGDAADPPRGDTARCRWPPGMRGADQSMLCAFGGRPEMTFDCGERNIIAARLSRGYAGARNDGPAAVVLIATGPEGGDMPEGQGINTAGRTVWACFFHVKVLMRCTTMSRRQRIQITSD